MQTNVKTRPSSPSMIFQTPRHTRIHGKAALEDGQKLYFAFLGFFSHDNGKQGGYDGKK